MRPCQCSRVSLSAVPDSCVNAIDCGYSCLEHLLVECVFYDEIAIALKLLVFLVCESVVQAGSIHLYYRLPSDITPDVRDLYPFQCGPAASGRE